MRLTGLRCRVARHRDRALGHRHARPAADRLRRPAAARWPAWTASKLPELRPSASVLGPLTAEAAAELGIAAGTPVVTATPDTMSAAVGSGAVGEHAAHFYLGTSSWLSCHVSYKKTDPLHAIASLPSALPGRYLVSCEQQTAGASLAMVRDRWLAGDARGAGRLRRARRSRRAGPARQRRRALLPVAERRAHARRRPPRARRLAQPQPRHDARAARPCGARGRRAQRALDAAVRWSGSASASSTRSRSSAAARARRCGRRSSPTCSAARSARAPTRSTPTCAARRFLAGIALGELRAEDIPARVSHGRDVHARSRPPRALRRALPRVRQGLQGDEADLPPPELEERDMTDQPAADPLDEIEAGAQALPRTPALQRAAARRRAAARGDPRGAAR